MAERGRGRENGRKKGVAERGGGREDRRDKRKIKPVGLAVRHLPSCLSPCKSTSVWAFLPV